MFKIKPYLTLVQNFQPRLTLNDLETFIFRKRTPGTLFYTVTAFDNVRNLNLHDLEMITEVISYDLIPQGQIKSIFRL